MKTKKEPIIILHGWGISGQKYSELENLLKKSGFKVYSPDLPGFGLEPLKKDMFLNDYVEFIFNFVKKTKLSKIVLIGHSFGGRVATKFAIVYPVLVSKLILTGAPLIKKPLSSKRKAAFVVSKIGKKIVPQFMFNLSRKVLYRSIGEWDYYKSGQLSKTLQNILAEDLKDLLPEIKIPTLIVWAKNDNFVPISIGREIAELIKGSKFELLEGTHKLPYDDPKVFYKAILPFINK